MSECPKEHLTDEELNRYADDFGNSSLAYVQHLNLCSRCRDRANELMAQQRKIESLRQFRSSVRASDCPQDEVWARIAAGGSPKEDAEAALAHAAGCSRCAEKLRNALEDRDAELEPYGSVIAGLPSSTPKAIARQAKLAARAARAGRPRPVTKLRFWLPTAAALLLAAAGAIFLTRPRPAEANRLLALAYESGRNLELRFPGAAYVPLRQERGGSVVAAPPPPEAHTASIQQPAAEGVPDSQPLLEALAKISAKVSLQDGRWLDSRGRAELLEWQYDRAISDLERAHTLTPNDPSILADLAAAYFERGQVTDTRSDYVTTLGFLTSAVERAPRNAEIRFNRAIVFGYLGRYREAVDEWSRFLSLNPAGGWADEARVRQRQAKEKLSTSR